MGISISAQFPSRFLRGSDVAGKKVNLKIKAVKIEKVFKQKVQKEVPTPIIYFEGKEKGVVLGKERAMEVAALYGDDTDGWVGKPVTMYTERKDIFGKTVEVLHFKKCEDPNLLSDDEKKKLGQEIDAVATSQS